MNYFRTAVLLAGLTALFMGVGFLIGGREGALIALLVAAVMNLFAYWNSDQMVLSMHGAAEIDERSAPELFAVVRDLAARLIAEFAGNLDRRLSGASTPATAPAELNGMALVFALLRARVARWFGRFSSDKDGTP